MGRWSRLFLLAVLTGLAGGFSAAAMEWGLHVGMQKLVGRVAPFCSADVLRFRWGVLLLPMAGGLGSGVIALLLRPRAAGSGTNALTRAFHRDHGELALRAPAIDATAAVGVISCGGSAGPEGPIAALGAALGSVCGRVFRASPRERRVLLLAGCAAGIGAIFRCPLGGALFAVSIPYSEPDYETDAIVPALVASVVAYSSLMALWGHGQPLLQHARELVFESPLHLLPFVVLGPLCGLVAIFFGMCFRVAAWLVARARAIPYWLLPAIGGLATGGLACVLPQVMDGRYQFIQAAMDGKLFDPAGPHWWWWVHLFGAVMLVKCVATSCTVGSGASGGVVGPSLFIGGAVGAFAGALLEALFPGTFPEPLRRALIPVGMGGVLAASMRTPLAAIIMVTEMTESYGLIVPLMVVCVMAYLVGRHWGLNNEQVPTAAQSPVHSADAVVQLLENSRVDAYLDRHWPLVVSPDAGLAEIVQQIEPGNRPTLAVIDGRNLLGIISLPDLDRVVSDPELARVVLAHDIMTEQFARLHPDHDLYYALEMFRREKHSVLPVVDREQPQRWLGMLTRRRVFDALQQQVEASRKFVLREYEGLLEIDQEARLDNLLLAVAPAQTPRLKRLMVPIDLIGVSIRQSQFRTRCGGQIVAIEEPDGRIQCPPDLDRPLESHHRLLAIMADAAPRPARCEPFTAVAATPTVNGEQPAVRPPSV